MDDLYNAEIIEKIERYLSGDMSDNERSAFEDELQKDDALRETFERHKLLLEGLKMSAYLEDRSRWEAVQEAIENEQSAPDIGDFKSEESATPPKQKWSCILLMAAALIGGVLLGIIGFKWWEGRSNQPKKQNTNSNIPIAEDESEEELLFGLPAQPEQLNIAFTKIEFIDGKWQKTPGQPSSRMVSINTTENTSITYQLSGDSLTFYLPPTPLNDWPKQSMSWTLIVKNGESQNYYEINSVYYPLFENDTPVPLGSVAAPPWSQILRQ